MHRPPIGKERIPRSDHRARGLQEPIGVPPPSAQAELHVHIEGTVSPERVRSIAVRNGPPDPDDCDPAKDAIARRAGLQGGRRRRGDVLRGEQCVNASLMQCTKNSTMYRTSEDCYDAAMDYSKCASANGVSRAEIMFDLQTHRFEDASGSAADPDVRNPRGVRAPKIAVRNRL